MGERHTDQAAGVTDSGTYFGDECIKASSIEIENLILKVVP